MTRYGVTKRLTALESTTEALEQESNRQPQTPLSETDPELAAIFDEYPTPLPRLKQGHIPNAAIEARAEDINPYGATRLTKIAELMESRSPGSAYGKGHAAAEPLP